MKKIIRAILVGFLLVNGINMVVLGSGEQRTERIFIETSDPVIHDSGEYIRIDVKELPNYLSEPGKPLLPMLVKTFTFPVGTKILDVKVSSSYKVLHLSKKIQPSPIPRPLGIDIISDSVLDSTIYNSDEFYPSQKYSVREGVGLDKGERVIFLTVYCYSRYKPAEDTIYIPDTVEVEIDYNPPESPLFTGNLYDLLIVTDEKFVPYLEPLVEHKEKMGIKTKVLTVQEIYPKYNGRDDAEDVKLAIADAVRSYGVKFVLLFGGRKGQTGEWWVPVRYSHNFDGAYSHGGVPYDPTYLTDLYFADLFKKDKAGNIFFEDWDFNGNGVFAEFDYFNPSIKDIIDYYPDVYVGRLPVRYSWEAETIIDKIITYETTASESWFKHAVVCSGDTFPPSRGATNPIYEGELEVGLTASYLESVGFTVDRLFTSTGAFTCKEDLQRAVNKGCGFVHTAGHGSPSVWGNFLPNAQTEDEFVVGFSIMNVRKFTTGYKLPVIVIGGCHNAQFNVTFQELIDHNFTYYDRYPFEGYLPTDVASWWVLQRGGGSIASIGNTGLGYGYIDQYSTYGLGGWIEPRFFYEYAVAGLRFLGELHGQAITDYINRKGPAIGDVNEDQIDRKTIEEWVLLGDPSLRVGGYGGSLDDGNDDNDSNELSMVSANPPDWNVGDKWRYKLTDIDLDISEVEGRALTVNLSTGEITLLVEDVSNGLYKTRVTSDQLDAYLDVTFDSYKEGSIPISFKVEIINASIDGVILFTQSNLDISSVNVTISGLLDTAVLLENLNLSLPSFVMPLLLKFFPTIPFEVNLLVYFDEPYEIFDFPLEVGKTWPLAGGVIHIDGTVQSEYMKLLQTADKILRIFGVKLIPPEFEKYLPVIDISQLLEDFGIPTSFEIPEMRRMFRSPVFECSKVVPVEVEGGTFNCYVIDVLEGVVEIYYSSEIDGFVGIHGDVHDFIPVIEDVDLEYIGS